MERDANVRKIADIDDDTLNSIGVFDHLPEIAWIYSSKAQLIYVNKYWATIIGTESQRWMTVENWVENLHPDDKERATLQWIDCVTKGVNFESKFRLKTGDGIFRWFLSRCHPTQFDYWTGVCTDIDESEKQMESYKTLTNDLSTKKEFILTVLDYLPVAVIVADEKGEIIFSNNKMEKIWSFSLKKSKSTKEYSEWVGFHPDGTQYQSNEWPLARSVDYGEVVKEEIAEINTADGGKTTISLSSSPIYNGEGKQIGAVVICENVQEKLDLQKERLDAVNEAKAAAETSRFKSNFIANMSHDIRTPINGIIGMTNLLLLSNLDTEQRENVVTIKECGQSLINLINDILDISKLEAGKMDLENIEFSLGTTLDAILKISNASLLATDKKLKIRGHKIALPPYVRGDSKRLEQILNNLVQNAIKFTKDGGSIDIYVKVEDEKDPEYVQAILKVVDTGIGISEETQKRLFMPFTQADSSTTRKYGGSGLGLSICKSFVTMMKGEIRVESAVGKGSTFTVKVPLGRVGDIYQTTSNELLVQNILDANERKRHKILLAEDNKISAVVAKRLLGLKGYENVVWIQNGKEAYEQFMVARTVSDQYSLILMDCQMPVMDGFESTRLIREVDKRIPIFALTASATQDDRNACLESGMDVVILKPFDPDTMVNKIDEYISKQIAPSSDSVRND